MLCLKKESLPNREGYITGYTRSHSVLPNGSIDSRGTTSNTISLGDGKVTGIGGGYSVTTTNVISLINFKRY